MLADNQGLVSGTVNKSAGREANFPPCKPIFHHDLNEMPTQGAHDTVKKALIGWAAFIFVAIFNFLAMSALTFGATDMISAEKSRGSGFTGPWFVSMAIVLAGVPVLFGIYMCLYSAARKNSSLNYLCFFCLMGAVVVWLGCMAIGVPGIGAGGLVEMVVAFSYGHVVPGLFLLVSTILWCIGAVYGASLFTAVHVQYQSAGGMEAARKEATKKAAETAYEHREEIKDVAWEHRDEIKKVAVDNQDLLVQVARENSDLAVQAAKENPDLAWQVAVAASQSEAPAASSSAAPSAAPSTNPFAAAAQEDVIDWNNFS